MTAIPRFFKITVIRGATVIPGATFIPESRVDKESMYCQHFLKTFLVKKLGA